MSQKGKNLARIGVLLQLGLLIGLAVTAIGMAWAFSVMAPGKPIDQHAMFTFFDVAVIASSFGVILALIGAVLILFALFSAKYRAPWFYRDLWAISVLWLIATPIGTFLGILMMIYLATHSHEFRAGPNG
jgi:hypothetical protein